MDSYGLWLLFLKEKFPRSEFLGQKLYVLLIGVVRLLSKKRLTIYLATSNAYGYLFPRFLPVTVIDLLIHFRQSVSIKCYSLLIQFYFPDNLSNFSYFLSPLELLYYELPLYILCSLSLWIIPHFLLDLQEYFLHFKQ